MKKTEPFTFTINTELKSSLKEASTNMNLSQSAYLGLALQEFLSNNIKDFKGNTITLKEQATAHKENFTSFIDFLLELNTKTKNMYEEGNQSKALTYYDELKKLFTSYQFDSLFNSLLVTLQEYSLYKFNSLKPDEFDLHKKFKESLSELIPNSKIVKKKFSVQHQPDFWIKIDNDYMPVEIKLHKFDKSAKEQLLRYMKYYKVSKGLAVASELTTGLPNSIRFLKLGM